MGNTFKGEKVQVKAENQLIGFACSHRRVVNSGLAWSLSSNRGKEVWLELECVSGEERKGPADGLDMGLSHSDFWIWGLNSWVGEWVIWEGDLSVITLKWRFHWKEEYWSLQGTLFMLK